MIKHQDISNKNLLEKIKSKQIVFGGNLKMKVYGSLQCKSGKRLKKENRVFFISESEALDNGFRPCSHCMSEKYKEWKLNNMG